MQRKVTPFMFLLISLLVLSLSVSVFAGKPADRKQKMDKVMIDAHHGYFDGNRIHSYMTNAGNTVEDWGGVSGMFWPSRASNKQINYMSGVWIAGKVNGLVRSACAEFASEWTAGEILADGTPSDRNADEYRIYKINKTDMVDPMGNDDWMEWPVDQGAPWLDLYPDNGDGTFGDGVYEPLNGDMPDIIGDQMIWYVMNDLYTPNHANLFNTAPLGVECQTKIWGWNRPDAFGDMMFVSFRLFNKSANDIEDCYLAVWDDVDLGDGGDDFVGSDTTLGMMYTYNGAADGVYGVACPALGIDFFQGALVAGAATDTGKAFGQKWPGMKNFPMTTGAYYQNGGGNIWGGPETANEAWNYLAGYHRDGSKFVNFDTKLEEWPCIYGHGDPVTDTGWLNSKEFTADDQRMMPACGPFVMAAGDSQEIVACYIIAQGTDYFTSITQLRLASDKAQTAYDIDFALPPSPAAPVMTATGLDKQIILTWEGSQELYEAVDNVDVDENLDPTYYTFQGYNIYQYETNLGLGTKKKIATYDVVDLVTEIKDLEFVNSLGETVEHAVQTGTDNGVKRYHILNSDPLRSNVKLINNRPYYFAVTAYGYNSYGIPKTLESSATIVTVYPQQPFGQGMVASSGDDSSIVVSHTGPSDGNVVVNIVDPSSVTGDNYQVSFYDGMVDDGHGGLTAGTVWKLTNTTTGEDLLEDQSHQGADATDEQFDVVEGIQVKVLGPALVGVGYSYTGARWASGASAMSPDGEIFFGGAYLGNNFQGSSLAPGEFRDIYMEWCALNTFVDSNGDGKYTPGEIYTVPADSGQIANRYNTWGAGHHIGQCVVPFKVWDIETDPANPRQLDVIVRDRDQNGQWDLNDAVAALYNYLFILDTDYDPDNWNPSAGGQDYMAQLDIDGGPTQWALWLGPRGSAPTYNGHWTITFVAPNVNTSSDAFSFSTSGLEPLATDSLAQVDIDRINVFPNPYFGANEEELTGLQHFVRFTHLPEECTIRIFNLAGELVRTLEHDGTQFEEWNMQNEFDVPVASGMYIAHIDCGDLGEKILKMAIITAAERLRNY